MEISKYFSNDYCEARLKFINAAMIKDLKLYSFILENYKAPSGDDLYIDIAKSNTNFKNTIVIISGTHGPEGYCGSAVQTGILNTLIDDIVCDNNLILIHALNPYGFAWDLRFNEDNIDLNRNFPDDFYNLPSSSEYDKIAEHTVPDLDDNEGLEKSRLKLFEYAANHGFEALQSALTSGQYTHEFGVYYGGKKPSWSHKVLIEYLEKTCADIENLCIIDIHTGLGKYGHGEIILDTNEDTVCYQTAQKIWGNEIKSTQSGKSVSAKLFGCIDSRICKLFVKQNAVFIALEFGTIDPISVFQATQKAAWLYKTNNRDNPKFNDFRTESKLAFYPQEDEWKSLVYDKAINVIKRAVDFYRGDNNGE